MCVLASLLSLPLCLAEITLRILYSGPGRTRSDGENPCHSSGEPDVEFDRPDVRSEERARDAAAKLREAGFRDDAILDLTPGSDKSLADAIGAGRR